MFTYALLDALEHADINKNGLIEVSELADYIDQKVRDFSFEAFRLRQIPQRNIVGNNFALTNRAVVLTAGTGSAAVGNAASSPTGAFLAKPTHVVIAPTPVDVLRAQGAGASLQKLPAGTETRWHGHNLHGRPPPRERVDRARCRQFPVKAPQLALTTDRRGHRRWFGSTSIASAAEMYDRAAYYVGP